MLRTLINKNPIAEHAIQEFGLECLKLSPEGGLLTGVTLALATSHMNARIRSNGISASEMWTQRDQISGEQLAIDDRQIIVKQHFERVQNHGRSSKPQMCHRDSVVTVGDLVYIASDKDKTKARDRYLVVQVDDTHCRIRKFSKSQFRSKSYNVKLSDCYLVDATTLAEPSHGTVRGLENRPTCEIDTRSLCCATLCVHLSLTDNLWMCIVLHLHLK